MFILRSITPNGEEYNTELGEKYIYIDKFESDQFEDEWCVSENCRHGAEDNAFGVVTFGKKQEAMPLWYSSENYIMTDNGKTFCKLIASIPQGFKKEDLV
tara:strand:+ start:128 stop:427 length:300 start_codon:yes stop_codon:yes gene_type:complete